LSLTPFLDALGSPGAAALLAVLLGFLAFAAYRRTRGVFTLNSLVVAVFGICSAVLLFDAVLRAR
jgi:hypothetical protein